MGIKIKDVSLLQLKKPELLLPSIVPCPKNSYQHFSPDTVSDRTDAKCAHSYNVFLPTNSYQLTDSRLAFLHYLAYFIRICL